ncbi:MAG TPA: transglycosylase domain-containing protein [Candidatus Dormibacteraeota bacterium]|nr:transglycosylase domain-containing protein [Candidatus Dormibacteraeota bacterium]
MAGNPGSDAVTPRPTGRGLIGWIGRHRVAIAAAVAVFFVACSAYVVWAVQDLPDPSADLSAAGDVIVLDRNGQTIEDWSPAGHYHVNLTLDQMGRYAPKAVLAAEDRNFYSHGAIDPASTARALSVDLTSGGFNEGGSTITQQLVKIQLLTPEKSLPRKVHELVLAIALEQRFSKDQILTMYLNRVYFGHGAYGIGAAAKTYFGKDAKDLTIAQAAFLAGLIQAPSAYDPVLHMDLAQKREQYVLDGLVSTHSISRDDEDKAKAEDVGKEMHIQASARQSKAPHFVDYVLGQLEQLFGAAAVQQGGLVVHTTLDLKLEALAQTAVAKGVSDLKWANVNNAALLAANPKTGEILAWVGSASYNNDAIGGQFDVVTAERQPGSSFKPYVYEAALRDHKITLATVLQDEPQDFGGYEPADFDNRGMGPLTARTALLFSRNIPAVEVGNKEGMSNVIDLAHAMGINGKLDPGLSTAIGGSDVTMLEHVQGYATFANQGTRVNLNDIVSVVDGHGNTVYQRPAPDTSSVITPAESYLITDVLKHYQYQWGFGWNRQMASKTGTSDNGNGQIPDSWVMAYNPDIAIGTWVGNTGANGKGGFINAFGESVGSSLLAYFVNGLPGNMRDWYTQPSGIVKGCGGDEIFLQGTQNQCNQASPSPSGSPTASPSASPSAGASPSPSASPSQSPPPASPPPASPPPPPPPSPQPSPS